MRINIKNYDTMYHIGESLPPYIKIENRTNTRKSYKIVSTSQKRGKSIKFYYPTPIQ